METENKFFTHFEPDVTVISSLKVFEGDFRLTAEYFKDNTAATYKSDLKFLPLSEFASVIGFGPFKRFYIDSPEYGVPLISSSEMMEVNPSCEGYISKELHKNYQKYLVEKGWLLVSCSGTLGNVTLVDNRLKGFAVSQHALRVIPKEEKYRGYLYSYLSSDIGQSEVKGKKSGAVIDEIYEDDLSRLPIPIVDQVVIENINKLIDKSIALREQANILLREASELFYEYNNLPQLNVSDANFFDREKLIQSRILKSISITGEFRLDAHFYNPIAELATNNIKNLSDSYGHMIDVTERIFYLNRFTRTFVEKDYGIPYLAGKDIIKIRPSDMSYLSKQETEDLSNYFLEKGWILLTCSGTIGRTCFIWHNYEKFVATHDIIRIVPNASIDAGYLSAFLASEYGYQQIVRYKHGAVIDHITPEQVNLVVVPIPDEKQQMIIGDKVRLAYEKRGEAIRLEDEAQIILKQSLT